MIVIPAIDLKGGKVVRLLQGDFKEEKVYSETADAVGKRFEEEGAERIHVVDLDGALKGEPRNLPCVESLLKSVRAPLEVGGGIRDLKTAGRYFGMGVRWVILGTQACLDPGFMREAVTEFGEKIIVGIDARSGFVATDGWTKVTKTRAADLAKAAGRLGAKTIIYTDISKDGALGGPNLKEIEAMSRAAKIALIASGGIRSLEDIRALLKLNVKNLTGVVIGKALYENKFRLRDAINACLGN